MQKAGWNIKKITLKNICNAENQDFKILNNNIRLLLENHENFGWPLASTPALHPREGGGQREVKMFWILYQENALWEKCSGQVRIKAKFALSQVYCHKKSRSKKIGTY